MPEPKGLQRKAMTFEIKRKGGQEPIEAWANTKTVDRMGDLVLPTAFKGGQWDGIKDFLRNPVMLLSHNMWEPPIGSVRNLTILPDGIKFNPDFAGTPKGQEIKTLYTEGHMAAFSIGFDVPDDGMREPTEDELKEYGPKLRRVIQKLTLYEISACTIPANQDALLVGRSLSFSPLEVNKLMTTLEKIQAMLAAKKARRRKDSAGGDDQPAASDDSRGQGGSDDSSSGDVSDAIDLAMQHCQTIKDMVDEHMGHLQACKDLADSDTGQGDGGDSGTDGAGDNSGSGDNSGGQGSDTFNSDDGSGKMLADALKEIADQI